MKQTKKTLSFFLLQTEKIQDKVVPASSDRTHHFCSLYPRVSSESGDASRKRTDDHNVDIWSTGTQEKYRAGKKRITSNT